MPFSQFNSSPCHRNMSVQDMLGRVGMCTHNTVISEQHTVSSVKCTYSAVYSTVESAVYSAVFSSVYSAVLSAVYSVVYSAMYSALYSAVYSVAYFAQNAVIYCTVHRLHTATGDLTLICDPSDGSCDAPQVTQH